MTDLQRQAHRALEGSDRSSTAMSSVRDYIRDLNDRSLFAVGDVSLNIEMGALFRLLASLADPDGESPYRLEIVPRNAAGRRPNPAAKHLRHTTSVLAALYVDRVLFREPDMQKKKAFSLAAEAFDVSVPEIYAARKSSDYASLADTMKH